MLSRPSIDIKDTTTWPLRFSVLMESIITVFIKLMGAAISGPWTISPDCTIL